MGAKARLSVGLDPETVDMLDDLVRNGDYHCRSAAIQGVIDGEVDLNDDDIDDDDIDDDDD